MHTEPKPMQFMNGLVYIVFSIFSLTNVKKTFIGFSIGAPVTGFLGYIEMVDKKLH